MSAWDALSGIFGFLGGLMDYAATQKTNSSNYVQYQDWKEYNSPAQQQDRLQKAGMNPYLVNGVSNTLSQPFQVGQSPNLANAFNNAAQAVSQASRNEITREANDIRRSAVGVQKDKLEFEKTFGDLKKDMMRQALKKGDAQTAMFWSSVNQKDIVTNYLKRTLPFRVGSSYYDYLQKQQAFTFNELMNPMKLQYYAPYQEAMLNNVLARTSHLKWYENFALNQFLFNQDKFARQMDLGWANNSLSNRKLLNDYDIANRRLTLSGLYYNLANRKFNADVMFRGLDNIYKFKPSYRSIIKRQPGSYPQTIFETTY